MRLRLLATLVLAVTLLHASALAFAQATDPLSVVKTSIDMINAGNIEGALGTFADDATYRTVAGTATGTEQIRRVLQAEPALHAHIEPSDFQVVGDKVTYNARRSDDNLRKLGLDTITATAEVTVQDGKIKSLSSTPSPESRARIQAAQAAAQQAPQALPTTGADVSPAYALVMMGGLAALALGLGLRRRYHRA